MAAGGHARRSTSVVCGRSGSMRAGPPSGAGSCANAWPPVVLASSCPHGLDQRPPGVANLVQTYVSAWRTALEPDPAGAAGRMHGPGRHSASGAAPAHPPLIEDTRPARLAGRDPGVASRTTDEPCSSSRRSPIRAAPQLNSRVAHPAHRPKSAGTAGAAGTGSAQPQGTGAGQPGRLGPDRRSDRRAALYKREHCPIPP